MASALANVEIAVAIQATKLLINNRWVNSASGKTFPSINPATGEEIAQVAEADAVDVDKAVGAARGFQYRPVAQDVGRRARANAEQAGRAD